MGAQHNKLMDQVAGTYHGDDGNALGMRDRIDILSAEAAVVPHIGRTAIRPPEALIQSAVTPLAGPETPQTPEAELPRAA